jgi:hypothetical protein
MLDFFAELNFAGEDPFTTSFWSINTNKYIVNYSVDTSQIIVHKKDDIPGKSNKVLESKLDVNLKSIINFEDKTPKLEEERINDKIESMLNLICFS